MSQPHIVYPEGHWLRGRDPAATLDRYLDQQAKAYSRIKNAFMIELLGDLAGKRVLDFGCGGGLLAVTAARARASVLGLDAEPGILAAARLLARRRGAGPGLRLACRANLPQPEECGRFAVIIAKDVLEHLPDDRAFLADAHRLLTPGGCIVIATQNRWSLNFILEGGYHRLLRRERGWWGWDPTHLRFYSPRSLRRALMAAGLFPVAWRGAFLLPYKLPAPAWSGRRFWRFDPLSRVDRWLGCCAPGNVLGWSLMVKARCPPA
ncbi:MAG: methyltransferase domain-containing protein [Pseudomonadota bacterium]